MRPIQCITEYEMTEIQKSIFVTFQTYGPKLTTTNSQLVVTTKLRWSIKLHSLQRHVTTAIFRKVQLVLTSLFCSGKICVFGKKALFREVGT